MTAHQDVSGSETLGGATITKTVGRDFAAADVGKPFFWADGSTSLIVKFLTVTTVEVADDASISSMAATISPTFRNFCDTLRDEDLRSRAAYYSLIQRFWTALPECDIGCITPGMMWVGLNGGTDIDYSQMLTGYEYLAGFHNAEKQTTSFKDQIRSVRPCPNTLAVVCGNSTHGIPLNQFNTETIPEVGVEVTTISGQVPIDLGIGLHDSGAIASVPNGGYALITNEPGIRTFDGTSYSPDYAEGRLTKILQTFQAGMACIYNTVTGFLFWGLDE
jgi:hypothetical protein